MQSHKMLFLTPGGRKIREDQKKKKEKRKVTNIALSMVPAVLVLYIQDFNPSISLITLNINGLNIPIKDRYCQSELKKDQTLAWLQEIKTTVRCY